MYMKMNALDMIIVKKLSNVLGQVIFSLKNHAIILGNITDKFIRTSMTQILHLNEYITEIFRNISHYLSAT